MDIPWCFGHYPAMTNDNQQEALNDAVASKVKHLRAVEGLSIRQISLALSISKDRVGRIIHDRSVVKAPKPTVVAPYERLIEEWFREHPYLQAQQVYERLKTYGYPGSYVRVVLHTRKYRRTRNRSITN
jgi:hypothetical protein